MSGRVRSTSDERLQPQGRRAVARAQAETSRRIPGVCRRRAPRLGARPSAGRGVVLMAYWPVALDVTRRPVVVIGAARAADAKVRGLLDAQAHVVVIAPRLTPQLKEWADAGEIVAHLRAATPQDVAGAALVIAASSDREQNREVTQWSRSLGVLVNCIDDREHCDCLAMARVQIGALTVAVSTGGRAPALARYVRERLEGLIDPRWAGLVERATEIRERVRGRWTYGDWEEWIARELAATSRVAGEERFET